MTFAQLAPVMAAVWACMGSAWATPTEPATPDNPSRNHAAPRTEVDQALVDSLLRASLLEPNSARAQVDLGVAYYQNGRYTAALAALARASELDPRDPLPYFLLASIHADHLNAGASVRAAREALARMPSPNALNQLAKNQKGSANPAWGLALYGLEEWAQTQAQDTYSSFWGGSHLFLADRYVGNFNKNSERLQGYLTDPLAFGASNRFSTLFMRPGVYGGLAGTVTGSRDAHAGNLELTVNGLSSTATPMAFLAQTTEGRQVLEIGNRRRIYNGLKTALGFSPSAELGVFLLADTFDASSTSGYVEYQPNFNNRFGEPTRLDHFLALDGASRRVDLGARYTLSDTEQMWVKWGESSSKATSVQSREENGSNTISGLRPSYFSNTEQQITHSNRRMHDLQWRYTQRSEPFEWTLGLEHAQGEKQVWRDSAYTNRSVSSPCCYYYFAGRQVLQDAEDRSQDLVIAGRWDLGRTDLEGGLFFQDHRKRLDVRIDAASSSAPWATIHTSTEHYRRRKLQPRLGMVHRFADGFALRAAHIRWQKPAQINTLSPVATAGIPLEDSLVLEGGQLRRNRVQLEWHNNRQFVSAFVGQDRVDHWVSPQVGVLNAQDDLSQIDALRNRSIVNFADMELLEGSVVFARGRVDQLGAAWNGMVDDEWGVYSRYRYTHSANESTGSAGNWLPYQPRHRVTSGFSWISPSRWQVGTQLTWRSKRYVNEANTQMLEAGWNLAAKAYWESPDKRWSIEGFIANLLQSQTNRLWGLNLQGRF